MPIEDDRQEAEEQRCLPSTAGPNAAWTIAAR